MASNTNFLVSTADFAFYYNDKLACTGTTNLNTSIAVTMEEQDVNGGKGNKLLYSFKSNRALEITLEAADWKLEYIAANVGSKITQGIEDVYHIAECNDVVNGIVTLKDTTVSDVAVEIKSGSIVIIPLDEVTNGTTIDLTPFNVTSGMVNCTYMYKALAKKVVIDADTSPLVGRLVLDADKHNNKVGKVGTVQIVIPSYALSGEFNIEFTPDGVTSSNMDGKALAVEGTTCADGSAIYGYITETDDNEEAVAVYDIVIDSAITVMRVGDTQTLKAVGIKSTLYETVEITGVRFTSATPAVATVVEATGVVNAVANGTAVITASYTNADGKTFTDKVTITVQN